MQITNENAELLVGRTLVDSDGDKIGKVADIYLDEATEKPEWMAVSTGWFGNNISFVPLKDMQFTDDDSDVVAPYWKQQVKDAPNCADDGSLSQVEEAELYRHFGLQYSETRSPSGLASGESSSNPKSSVGNDQDNRSAMVRSEEELQVAKTQQEAGKVRLRKYVVTEEQTVRVPVTREEVRIEREPLQEGDRATIAGGATIGDDAMEMTLHEEQIVVSKKVVPKEKIKMAKEEIVEEERVSETVRKEQFDIEGDKK